MTNRTIKTIVLAAAVLVLAASASATILATVPMQGTMVHINVLFHNQATNSLSAVVDPVVPQLTPLLLSNPADSFNSADPWYTPLQLNGDAFSRRYGFVVASGSDSIPSNLSIWIREDSVSSPLLQSYQYRTNPNLFNPMLGWASSDPVWKWDLSMFHPAYAVPATSFGHWSATYELFVADLATGKPAAGYTSTLVTLQWTSLPPWPIGLGDFSGDGYVNQADYTTWADSFGKDRASCFAPGSYDTPDVITQADYTTWADHYGASTHPMMVPEPATLALLAAGALLLRRRQR